MLPRTPMPYAFSFLRVCWILRFSPIVHMGCLYSRRGAREHILDVQNPRSYGVAPPPPPPRSMCMFPPLWPLCGKQNLAPAAVEECDANLWGCSVSKARFCVVGPVICAKPCTCCAGRMANRRKSKGCCLEIERLQRRVQWQSRQIDCPDS